MHLCTQQVKLNKHIFIGQCVLDQSSHMMKDSHSNTMVSDFCKENVDLLFADTNGLC